MPQSIRRWTLEHVCPYWCERIVDPRGGYFEALDERGEAVRSPAKTALNQARLTYVLSHASILGGSASLRRAADHGFDFLQRSSAINGRFEGWHRSTDNQGAILDSARDTYDHAFVIFAMAWYHRASPSPEALRLAEQAFTFLDDNLRDAVHGGFFEEYPSIDKLPRRQNPHMHLLEAMLAMHAATGEKIWLERAAGIIELFKDVFFDRKTGSLAEFFDAKWNVAQGSPGLQREPGHQFEWVWLLGQFASQAGANDFEKYAEALFSFGTKHGIDPAGRLRGIVIDAVSAAGTVLADSKLLWPQTEYIKACIARFESTQEAIYKDAAFAHLHLVRTHFFRADGATWINQVSRDGIPMVSETPSRILYHLFLAAAELMRIEES